MNQAEPKAIMDNPADCIDKQKHDYYHEKLEYYYKKHGCYYEDEDDESDVDFMCIPQPKICGIKLIFKSMTKLILYHHLKYLQSQTTHNPE